MSKKLLNLHLLTLAFQGELRDLEAQYKFWYFDTILVQLRAALIASIVFIFLFTPVYYLYYPKYLYTLSLLMILAVIPVFMICFVCSFFRWFRRWYKFISMFLVILVGIYFNLAIVIVDTPDIYPLVFGILVCYIFNYIFTKLFFLESLISGWILFVITASNILSFIDPTTSAIYYTVIYEVFVFSLLGTVISYLTARKHRYEFFLEHELIREKNNLQRVNDKLCNSLKEIKTLKGILSMCCVCGLIRDDTGVEQGKEEWIKVDTFVQRKTDAKVSHSYCPKCYEKAMEELVT